MTDTTSNDFIHGFALAISVAYRENCEARPLKAAINASGFKMADFKKADIPSYDIESIKEIIKNG